MWGCHYNYCNDNLTTFLHLGFYTQLKDKFLLHTSSFTNGYVDNFKTNSKVILFNVHEIQYFYCDIPHLKSQKWYITFFAFLELQILHQICGFSINSKLVK